MESERILLDTIGPSNLPTATHGHHGNLQSESDMNPVNQMMSNWNTSSNNPWTSASKSNLMERSVKFNSGSNHHSLDHAGIGMDINRSPTPMLRSNPPTSIRHSMKNMSRTHMSHSNQARTMKQSAGWRGTSAPPVNRNPLASTWGGGIVDYQNTNRNVSSLVSHSNDVPVPDIPWDGSFLECGEEVLRTELRLCIKGGTSKVLPHKSRWVLEHGTPLQGSSNGDVWQDVQVRLLRSTLPNIADDIDDRWSEVGTAANGPSEAIIFEITAPSIPSASEFCLISIITPNYFRKLQVEQRMTVDWYNFTNLFAEMITTCNDNAISFTNSVMGDSESANRNGSAQRSRPQSYAGGRICSLGPPDAVSGSLSQLEFSIIEPSSLREIVHLNLPITCATGDVLQTHLIRVLEELKIHSDNLERSVEEHKTTIRSREAQWQRLETLRTTSQTQKIHDLETKLKQVTEELVETKAKAESSVLELQTKRTLADASIALKSEVAELRQELEHTRPQLKAALEKKTELQSELNRMKDLMKLVQPDSVEHLRLVCVEQKNLLTEFELEVAQHAQIYASLHNKVSQLCQENDELNTKLKRAQKKAADLEEIYKQHRETKMNEGTVSEMQRLEMKRLEIANEELQLLLNEAEAARKKLSNDLRNKIQLVEYLHSELNKANLMKRTGTSTIPTKDENAADIQNTLSMMPPPQLVQPGVQSNYMSVNSLLQGALEKNQSKATDSIDAAEPTPDVPNENTEPNEDQGNSKGTTPSWRAIWRNKAPNEDNK